MAVTRLYWDSLSPNSSRLTSFPWITGKVRKVTLTPCSTSFAVGSIMKLKKSIRLIHGTASRPVPGASVASEHSTGTAIDLNVPKHPLGRTFTSSQVTRINRILKDLDGAVR